jgi:hypothetical protein
MTAPTLRETPRQRRLPAYAVWQLRDYLIEKGAATVLVLSLFGYLAAWVPLLMARRSGQGVEDLVPLFDQVTVALLGQLVLIGALFAVNGIVAEDRKQGFYRFYFAKPVNVPAFYAQKFAMHLLGFLAVAAVLMGIYIGFIRGLPVATLLPTLAALFVGVAGIGFLISALWRYDLMSLIAFYFAANVFWPMFADDEGWRGMMVHLLPPLHRVDEVFQPIMAGSGPPMSLLAWLTGYGLVCILLGLLVIRQKPLSSP